MKTWDIDDKVDAVYEMRMEEVNHAIRTGGAASGGLTVRDYFAAKALPVLITEDGTCDFEMIARDAYEVADCMMLARDRKEPEPCSVEEAFGL